MAQSVKLSPAHLHRLFKEQTDLSPILYLRQLRLEKARALLENSHERIKDIRLHVGMRDPSHFTHDFKAKYGLAPSDYRRQK
jgi:iron complex transport system substrate-binding protein